MEMLTYPRGFALPIAPVAAVAVSFAAAAIVATLPTPWFEGLVVASNLPSVIAAATPPLGLTARLLVGVLLFALTALIVFAPLAFLLGGRTVRVRWGEPKIVSKGGPPVFRTPPPATPVRPIVAHAELGAPFLSVNAKVPEPVQPVQQPELEPEPVTETVEIAEAVFIPERRSQVREEPKSPLDAATVANLLERLETALGDQPILPRRRPVDPAFIARIQALRASRRMVATG